MTGFCFASPEIQNGHPAEAAAKAGRHGTGWAVMIPAVPTQADVSTFAKSDEHDKSRLRENSRKENRKGSKDRFSGGRDQILRVKDMATENLDYAAIARFWEHR